MAAEEPPDWLPDGWYVGVRTLQDGRVERVYTSPLSGHTFSSKSDVLRYLNFEKVEGHQPKSTVSGYEDHFENDSAQEDTPLWLPQGWILEIKTRKTGKTAGVKYKCYFDPSTGSRFYSKMEVFRFLEGEQARNKGDTSKRNWGEHIIKEDRDKSSGLNGSDDSDSPDNVLSQIESSPDGLPSGWIKEIRYKRNASGIRKDPYYKDPVSGYVFRSKKDVFRYLETGVISKHAFKTKNSFKYAIEELESPAPISARPPKQAEAATSQCLLVSPSSSSEKNASLSFGDGSFQNSDLGAEGPTMNLITIPDANNLKESHAQVKNSSRIHVDQNCEPYLSERQTGQLQMLEQTEVAEKFLAPLIDNLSNPSEVKVGELETVISSDSEHGEFPHLESSNKENQVGIFPSTRRHGKKLAVRRFPKDNVDDAALPDSSNQLHPQQSVNINLDDLPSHNSTDAANHPTLYSADEKLSELERMSCEKVDDRVAPNMSITGIPSEQVDDKQKDTLPVDDEYEPRARFTKEANKQLGTSRKRPESADTASEKKRKMANELSSDTKMKHVTRGRSGGPTKAPSKGAKSVFSPHRSSRRLAGLNPDLTADIDVSYRSLKRAMHKENKPSVTVDQKDQVALKVSDSHETLIGKAKGKEPASPEVEPEERHLGTTQLNSYKKESSGTTLPAASSDSRKTSKGKEHVSLDQEPEPEHPGSTQTNGGERREPPFPLPFGDAWPDPCIEFAFKTLTGDIPVFDDSLNIKDYLQQQISPITTRTTTTPLDNVEQLATSNPPARLDGTNDHPNAVSAANAQQGRPLTNARQTGGDMDRTSKTVKVKN